MNRMDNRMNVVRTLSRTALVATVAFGLLLAGPAAASRFTDIVDPFPRDGDGAQINVEIGVIGFDYWAKSGLITREFTCVSTDKDSQALCPNGSKILDRKEMRYESSAQGLNFSAKIGFWRVASLELHLPYVLSNQTTLDYDEGVSGSNSSVNPDGAAPKLFALPFDGRDRSGIGDLEARIRFAPLSLARDIAKPNWVVDINIVFPTSTLKSVDNDAPGQGLWQIELSTAVSARFMPWLEPYFKLGGNFRLTGADTFFEEYGNTQTLAAPGHQLLIALGVDLIPYENQGKEEFFTIDIGADLRFQFEGREYTALYEALGGSDCDPGDDNQACDLTTYTRGDIDPATGERRKSDGLTDIEQFATVRGWVGFRWQMWKHIQLRFMGWIGHETSHFLTTADAGVDLDNKNQVEASNSDGVNEYNPVYNDAYDSIGTRFRTANTFLWGLNVKLIGKF